MADQFNNKEFEKHISKLIITKDIYRMLDQLKSIMRKIVFLIGEENWNNNSFSDFQKKHSMEFIIDYSFIYCVNELITVLNDSGTLAPMSGAKKWMENYEIKFVEFFNKSKEISSIKQHFTF